MKFLKICKTKESIKELVELENGIDVDEDMSIVLALSDEELFKIVNLNNIHSITKIYIANDVFITPHQEQILKRNNIEINIIPDYYYGELK